MANIYFLLSLHFGSEWISGCSSAQRVLASWDAHRRDTLYIPHLHFSSIIYILSACCIIERKTNRASRNNQCVFKLLLVCGSHYVSLWPKQVTWPAHTREWGNMLRLHDTASHVAMDGDVLYFGNEEGSE